MEEAIQKFPKVRHRHFLTWSLIVLLLGLSVFVWWSLKHAEERIVELEGQKAALEKENKEYAAQPVVTPPPSVLTAAVGRVPICGEWVTDPAYKVPSADVIADLSLGDLLDEGYAIVDICVDATDDRIAFIAAKDDNGENDVFGTVVASNGLLTVKRSALNLGLFAAQPNACRVDGVARGETASSDRLLLYCGPKGGSLTAWYAYDVKDDKMTLAQEYTGEKDHEYAVREGAILEQFHIRRRP
jgi:hypothetical protein